MKAIIIVAIFVFVANMQQMKLEVIFTVLRFCCKYATKLWIWFKYEGYPQIHGFIYTFFSNFIDFREFILEMIHHKAYICENKYIYFIRIIGNISALIRYKFLICIVYFIFFYVYLYLWSVSLNHWEGRHFCQPKAFWWRIYLFQS